MIQARHDHAATLLANGQVRATNGTNAAGAAATITELYNPIAGSWTKQ